MVPKLTKKEQNKQMNKEAIICMVVYVGYFIWWFATGFGLGAKDPAEYTYVMGLPMWFFLSSIVGFILFCAATIVVAKYLFKNFDLEETEEEVE